MSMSEISQRAVSLISDLQGDFASQMAVYRIMSKALEDIASMDVGPQNQIAKNALRDCATEMTRRLAESRTPKESR